MVGERRKGRKVQRKGMKVQRKRGDEGENEERREEQIGGKN